MNVSYITEYRDILVETEQLHREAEFLSQCTSLDSRRSRLLDQAEVCMAIVL